MRHKNPVDLTVLSLVAWLTLPCAAAADSGSRYMQNVLVEPGDTLWSLSQRYLKDPKKWPQIIEHNPLPGADPSVTLPGKTLKIPVLLIKESLRAAKLIERINIVTYRERDSALWQRATIGLQLRQDDGIRTEESSRASIQFAIGENLNLGPNSFAVIKPEALNDDLPGGASLLSGEVRSRGVRLVTQTALIVPKDKQTDYRAKIEKDLSTIVQVYTGAADVSAKGKTITLKEGFATKVAVGSAPKTPSPIPSTPKMWSGSGPFLPGVLGQERPLGALLIQDGRIMFNMPAADNGPKTGVGSVARKNLDKLEFFRVQLAATQKFEDVLWDKVYPIDLGIRLADTKLKDGDYYLRTAYIDQLGFESDFGVPQKISIDTKFPLLQMLDPKSTSILTRLNPMPLRARTEPGSTVLINGRINQRLDDEGVFTEDVLLKPGNNSVSILAFDKSSNKNELTIDVFYEAEGVDITTRKLKGERRPTTGKTSEEIKAERVARLILALTTAVTIASIVLLLAF